MNLRDAINKTRDDLMNTAIAHSVSTRIALETVLKAAQKRLEYETNWLPGYTPLTEKVSQ